MRSRTPDRDWMRALLVLVVLVPVAMLIIMLAALARAQDPNVHWDPIGWGSNPALATLALAGLVAGIRKSSLGAAIDGTRRVWAFTAVLGAVGGMGLQALGFLSIEQFATLPSPWGGALYGLFLAFSAITGVSAFNYGASKLAQATSTTQPTGLTFVTDLVKSLVSKTQLPTAMTAVAPVLAEIAQSETVLTDDRRAALHAQVLTLLRKAGIKGVDL